MAIIKKFSPFQNLSSFQVFLNDTAPNSQYFKITELNQTLTGGKNGFLIEGSEFLKESTEVKIEILDVENNPIYYEPGDGIPEYYEGVSKLVSVHVYDDTPIGTGKITILGELKNYVDENGAIVPVPDEWKGIYNVKWETTFQINKNLNNETIVRFYKRPIVNITELVKPIFSKSIPTVTDTGYAHGISETPIDGTDIRNWRTGTLYRLRRTSGTWDRDVDENTITFSSPSFTANIIEVLNDTDVLVDVPYTVDNFVSNFTSGSYSVSYADFQNEVIGESTLTGSFAKIDITQLKTFVGDVARVKVFRKSRNSVGDFQFVQESKLESTELLRDVTTPSNTEIPYGRFDESNLSTYWITSSNDHPVSIDSSALSQAVKFDYNNDSGSVQQLITSQSFSISKDVEYTLNFRTLLSGSLDDSGKSVRAFFSSSTFTQDFLTVSGSAIYRTRQNVSQNILSENTGDAHLVFEVKGDDWYVSNVSLKNAQDTSFSPDEFTLIQDIPRKLVSETFDFRFEFYDINNNYIPVDVTAVGVFDGGNDFPTSGKLLTFESDRNAFRFTSGSIGSPPLQQLQFKVTQNNLTGSVIYTSQSFDVDGNLITSASYHDSGVLEYPGGFSGSYPGELTTITNAGALLTIANFSGSVESITVGSIVYTASLDSLQEFETVYRLEDGDNAPSLLVTSNANQFIYEPTALEPKPSGQSITIRAQRKNLASLITPITVNKSDSNAPDLNEGSTVNGVTSYTLSALEFSASFAENNFDEVTYSFTGSDVFGNQQTDEITLSKVINFDGVSIVLSTENTSFQSDSTGTVTATEFNKGDGTVDVRVGSKVITHDDAGGGTAKNTFDIVSVTPSTGLTANSTSPTDNSYGISAMSVDSGTLTLLIRYKAGDDSTTVDFTKVVNYSKNKKAAPVISIETTNKDQSVSALSTGEQVDFFSNSVVTVKETYNGSTNSKTITSLTATSSDISSISTTPSTGIITLSGKTLANGTNTTKVAVSATVTDSEGSSRTVTDTISLSKVKKAEPSITFSATPQAQTIDAKSTGVLIGSITDVVISGFEGNTALTYNQGTLSDSQYKITNVSGVTVADTTPSTSTIDITSFSGDSATGTASIAYQDSEGNTGTQTIKFSLAKSKASAPAVLITATPQSQTVSANSSGTQTGTLTNVVVSVENGSFVSMTKTQSGFSTNPTISTNTLTMSAAVMNASEASVTLTVNYTDTEGTSGSQTVVIRCSKISDGTPGTNGVSIIPSLSSQNVVRDFEAGTFSSVSAVTHAVKQGSTTYTAVASSATLANEQYQVKTSSLTNCTETDDGEITPTQPSSSTFTTGGTASYTIKYKDSDGNVNELEFSHEVTVTTNGTTGPGVVFSGEWAAGIQYQFSTGVTGRRDAVIYNGTYYATTASHTSTDNTSSSTGRPGFGPWESLGSGTRFSAAEITISKQSYIKETLTIGTNDIGSAYAANITAYGGNAYPYIAIGQSSNAYGNNGIWIGRDYNGGTPKYRMSLVNGTSSYLKWTGDGLEIKGSITVTGGDAATQTYANTIGTNSVASGSASAAAAQTAAELFASSAAANAVVSGSLSADAAETAAIAQAISDASASINLLANGNWVGGNGVFITANSISAPVIAGNAGYISGVFKVGQNGITLDGPNQKIFTGTGTYANANTPFYVDNSSNFSLGDKISWNGTTLSIAGTVSIAGTAASTVTSGAAAGASATQPGDNISTLNNNSGYQNNTATRTGGSVGGWALEQYKIKGGSPSSGGDGVFTNTGIILGIESVSGDGYISAQNFYVSSSGDAVFGGTLSGAQIYGGSININDNFNVGPAGTMTANNAVISGQITSEDATLGAWSVGPDAIESDNGKITLNATDANILLRDDNLVTKVNLNTGSALTTPSAGGSIAGTTNASVQTDDENVSTDGIKYYVTTQGNDAEDIGNFTPSTSATWTVGYSYTNGAQSSVYASGAGNFSSVSVYLEVRTGANGGGTLVKAAYIQSAYVTGTDAGFASVDGNTKITLSDGTTKLAKDIKKNDALLVWDESTNSFKSSGVSDIRQKIVERVYEIYVDDIKLVTSENHGFWIDGGAQIKVEDIVENQTKIYVKDSETIKLKTITSVKVLEKQSQVITFKIPKYENYVSENIISHNPAGDTYPVTETAFFTSRTGSTSMSLSSGTTYYLRLRYDWTRTLIGSDFQSLRDAGYSMNFDGNYNGNALNAGTEINNAGLQVLSGTNRVFRADTASSTGPWMTLIGGMNVDYFMPRYSMHSSQSKSWGQFNNELGYDKRAYPVTRAMCKFTVSSSFFVTLNNPQLNIATVSRSSVGVYVITLEDDLGTEKGLPIISSYGRAGDGPSYNPTDDEFTSNMGARHNTSVDSYTLGFKDNDRNTNDDPYKVHFVVFG